jgi:hypothetical protein
MIILSVGMPRAGSGWHYNLIHELALATGAIDARQIRKQYHLENLLTEVNCNIGVLSLRRLARVLVPSLMGHTFVIKAHSAPTQWSRLLTNAGHMKITYIYRDPRDAMLSAYDFGQRALEKGRPNAFSHLKDFDTALKFQLEYVAIWQQWIKEPNILKAKYEDLIINYKDESEKLLNYLNLDPMSSSVRAVIDKYRPEQASPTDAGLHFYKGKIGRFREAWMPQQRQILNETLSPYLQRMGYDV